MPKFKPASGDWICSNKQCENVNWSKRDKCNKCGSEKAKGVEYKKTGSEIGKQAAEKSKGLFSAEDWMCKSCGNVNWARRNQCNVCNSAKFQVAEQRTGLGGGYYERNEVEYKDHKQCSDDEYDEFGRKKKTVKGNCISSDPPVAEVATDLAKEVTSEKDGVEESEDDDDDFDESKYNLDSEDDAADDSASSSSSSSSSHSSSSLNRSERDHEKRQYSPQRSASPRDRSRSPQR